MKLFVLQEHPVGQCTFVWKKNELDQKEEGNENFLATVASRRCLFATTAHVASKFAKCALRRTSGALLMVLPGFVRTVAEFA